MKESLKRFGSKLVAGVAAVGTALGGAIAAHAEGATSVADSMVSEVNSGAGQAVTSITSMLGNIAPLIIGIVIGVVVLTAGIAWIKKIRSNAK